MVIGNAEEINTPADLLQAVRVTVEYANDRRARYLESISRCVEAALPPTYQGATTHITLRCYWNEAFDEYRLVPGPHHDSP